MPYLGSAVSVHMLLSGISDWGASVGLIGDLSFLSHAKCPILLLSILLILTLLFLTSQGGHAILISICRMSLGWASAKAPQYLWNPVSINRLFRMGTPLGVKGRCAFHSSHCHGVSEAWEFFLLGSALYSSPYPLDRVASCYFCWEEWLLRCNVQCMASSMTLPRSCLLMFQWQVPPKARLFEHVLSNII